MTKVKKVTKRLISIALTAIIMISPVYITPIVTEAASGNTVADWKFGQSGVKSGTIAGGDLTISDQSGNNNDLQMQLYSGKQLTTNFLHKRVIMMAGVRVSVTTITVFLSIVRCLCVKRHPILPMIHPREIVLIWWCRQEVITI